MIPSRDRFGFSIVSKDEGTTRRSYARFACRCGATADVPTRFPLNPEDASKRCERDHGWKADPWHAGRARCAACLNRKSPGDSPGPKETVMEPKKLVVATPREATPQEKQRIRAKLDANFDDVAGSYLSGYSDQKIGEELNIPWAIVAKIREVGYGPIKVDPEIAGLRADIADIGRRIEALTTAQRQVIDKLTAIETKRSAS